MFFRSLLISRKTSNGSNFDSIASNGLQTKLAIRKLDLHAPTRVKPPTDCNAWSSISEPLQSAFTLKRGGLHQASLLQEAQVHEFVMPSNVFVTGEDETWSDPSLLRSPALKSVWNVLMPVGNIISIVKIEGLKTTCRLKIVAEKIE